MSISQPAASIDAELATALDKVSYILDKAYLTRLKNDYGVIPFGDFIEDCKGINYADNIRVIRVARWVKDAEESVIDCFKNVLGLFSKNGRDMATTCTQ